MKYAHWLLIPLFWCQILAAKSYSFQATKDHFWTNPDNWFPTYPGTQLAATDTIHVLANVHFQGFDLQLEGCMHVALGVRIFSAKQSLIIHPSGRLDNEGNLNLHSLISSGKAYNRLSGRVIANHIRCMTGSDLYNANTASICIYHTFDQAGNFYNYGLCEVHNVWQKRAFYYAGAQAQMRYNPAQGDPAIPQASLRSGNNQ